MSKQKTIRCFDYVNHPYETVRDALREAPPEVFHHATQSAAARAHSVAAALRVKIAGIELGTDVSIAVFKVEEQPAQVKAPPVTRIQLEWEAANRPHLFPLMEAELSIYPLTPTETQLDFQGTYDPPFGILGEWVDTLIGHRIAEASSHHFVQDVAAYLRGYLNS
jgi:hypothetical protein